MFQAGRSTDLELGFGDIVRIARMLHRAKQQTIARRARLTSPELSLIENGRRVASPRERERLAKALPVLATLTAAFAARSTS